MEALYIFYYDEEVFSGWEVGKGRSPRTVWKTVVDL